ncbi:MAG: type III-B CRISPR module RAMP protein Cmr4, partial [Chloroflexi bacterium]|nr:type III-B CRISPR module RAMP protein Cmr4 [Chloroflexota bacterium]
MLNVKTLFLYTESATHAGTGTGLGAVDLPIQREQTTGYPIIQGSGVKGAIRSQSPSTDAEKAKDKNVVFGPKSDPNSPPTFAGAAAFGDARVLLFPVRALNGVFVWITCRSVLARFVRDCHPPDVPPLPPLLSGDQALVSSQD